jgi:hypothetical protein
MRSFKDMDNVLDILAEEARTALLQPDTFAPTEYFEIYERKGALELDKTLMPAVLEDATGCFRNFVCATNNRAEEMASGSGGMV